MTTPPASRFLQEMTARGYVHQCSDAAGLDEAAATLVMSGYIGFDCTAPSLHAGNLLGIMMLRKFQQAGHRPIVLVGGGTTRVGDPSGKDTTRKILPDDEIRKNTENIRRVFSRFLDFGDGPADALMVDNSEWLNGLNYIDFLRDYGRHFSVSRMLTSDSIRLRLEREQPMSLLEFNYAILQAYDFLELYRRYGCRLQMGGSDQWGNIVSGIDLARRVEKQPLFALTTALLTLSSGAKMGKTEKGALWLDPEMTSPWDYWQFWRNTPDEDVARFLKLFTELPLEEIARLESLKGEEINEAKKRLATEATALAHGRKAAEESERTARETFEQGATAAGLPTHDLPAKELESGIGLLTVLVRAGLTASNAEGRRHVQGGAVRVNDEVVEVESRRLSRDDVTDGVIRLSLGRKRHVLIRLAD